MKKTVQSRPSMGPSKMAFSAESAGNTIRCTPIILTIPWGSKPHRLRPLLNYIALISSRTDSTPVSGLLHGVFVNRNVLMAKKPAPHVGTGREAENWRQIRPSGNWRRGFSQHVHRFTHFSGIIRSESFVFRCNDSVRFSLVYDHFDRLWMSGFHSV